MWVTIILVGTGVLDCPYCKQSNFRRGELRSPILFRFLLVLRAIRESPLRVCFNSTSYSVGERLARNPQSSTSLASGNPTRCSRLFLREDTIFPYKDKYCISVGEAISLPFVYRVVEFFCAYCTKRKSGYRFAIFQIDSRTKTSPALREALF